MARFLCRCGNELSNSTAPEIEYRVYTYKEWEIILTDENITEPILVPLSDHTAWVCPQCERVFLWDWRNILKFIFIPEEKIDFFNDITFLKHETLCRCGKMLFSASTPEVENYIYIQIMNGLIL